MMLCTKTQPCAEYCDSHYIIIMYNPTTASAVNQIHPQSYSRALFLSPHTVHMSCYRWLLLHCHRKVHKTDWQAINTWPSSSSAASPFKWMEQRRSEIQFTIERSSSFVPFRVGRRHFLCGNYLFLLNVLQSGGKWHATAIINGLERFDLGNCIMLRYIVAIAYGV